MFKHAEEEPVKTAAKAALAVGVLLAAVGVSYYYLVWAPVPQNPPCEYSSDAERAELQKLVVLQDSFARQHGAFAPRLDLLAYAPPSNMLVRIDTANGGWRAWVQATTGAQQSCELHLGPTDNRDRIEDRVKCARHCE